MNGREALRSLAGRCRKRAPASWAAGEIQRVVEYRTFHNDDPPGLAEIWNEALTGRGAAQLRNSSPLERLAFAKPYFDPTGLIVALDGNSRVGFAHAGFGPNPREAALAHASGVTCLTAVRPAYRRRGIGTNSWIDRWPT